MLHRSPRGTNCSGYRSSLSRPLKIFIASDQVCDFFFIPIALHGFRLYFSLDSSGLLTADQASDKKPVISI